MPSNNAQSNRKSAVPDWKLTVGSAQLDTDSLDGKEIVIDELADGPSMGYVRLNTHDLEWINSDKIKLKGAFKVDLGFAQSKEPPIPVFQGTIHGWEPIFHGKTPATVVVRGFNKLHGASRGRKTRAWLDKKLSEVAGQLAGEHGMGSCGIDDTKIKQPYIYQANISDLDLLRELAERVGFEVGCDVQDNLRFRLPKTGEGEVAELVWGDNLKRFKSRMNTGQPVPSVTCVGWDVKQKKTVSGSACQGDVTSPMGGAKNSAQHAEAFSGQELYIDNRPYYSQQDAEAEAKGRINQLALQLLIAEAECEGTARAQAGKVVKVTGVGSRFDGKYYIIRARHTLRPNSAMPDAGFVTYLTLRRTGTNE